MIDIRYTANFAANLDSIEVFWEENEFPQGFDRLLDELTDTVLVNLERHPRMGRGFLERRSQTVEALARVDKLRARLAVMAPDAGIREYVMDDYLVLYALSGQIIYLLAIKHHKQLSFDVDGFLSGPDASPKDRF